MKQSISKLRLGSVAFCLVAILFAFVATSVENRLESEERSSEMVELEECQAVSDKRERRKRRRIQESALGVVRIMTAARPFPSDPTDRVYRKSERCELNGNGSYLLI